MRIDVNKQRIVEQETFLFHTDKPWLLTANFTGNGFDGTPESRA